ncbi:hypothetical protein Ae331Ps2_6179c [Pseudonocardia sp. Ae331_Ps2]|nr:hypothetical protein Ae331Ps2_6179c [Pseudonocardia sp. Ae331_Ps2]
MSDGDGNGVAHDPARQPPGRPQPLGSARGAGGSDPRRPGIGGG